MNPNPQQKEVVEHFEGPCLVLAVPGSGKTASVTERIKRLVSLGTDPKSILAITFTNKAAGEMRDRIAGAVGKEKASQMTISTFHSMCSRIIRANAGLLGLPKGYTIYDSDDQERLLTRCIRKIEDPESLEEADPAKPSRPHRPYKPTFEYVNALMAHIEGKRNSCLSDGEAMEQYPLAGNQSRVVQEYFAQLKAANAVDFTGLLSETLRLFTEHPEVAKRYGDWWKFISVDEVQDTNIAQFEIIKHLGLEHKNVLCVGDADQSIYAWRGACPANVLKFKELFGAKVLKVENNYRSTPSILKYCQKLIDYNSGRLGTNLVTGNPDASPPSILASQTDLDMAEAVARGVERKLADGTRPSEIAVFYRTNYASRVIENALRNRRIKYRIIGGLSFWDRKEIKNSLSILKVLANGADRMSFEKAAEACCRGVGEKAFEKVAENARLQGTSIIHAAGQFCMVPSASGRGLAPFVAALKECSVGLGTAAPGGGGMLLTPGQALLKVAKSTAFWGRLEADSKDTNDRCGNLLEMARDVDERCSTGSTLDGYLQGISLLTSADEEEDEKQVKLMTLHGSKGLEFDAVFITHCNEGLLPHGRAAEGGRQAIEEERRLLYVGMTRARKFLTLLFSWTKTDARYKGSSRIEPSRFLIETGIPCQGLKKRDFDD